MDTILTGDIWRQVRPHSKTATRRLIAVAYVTTDTNILFRRNDVLVCDASDLAIKTAKTSAHLLQSLHKKGIELRSNPDLHAKVAVLGRYAVVGSCNLSAASAQDLIELAVLTDRQQVVAQATAFIHALRETSEEIDEPFLTKNSKDKSSEDQKTRVEGKGPPGTTFRRQGLAYFRART